MTEYINNITKLKEVFGKIKEIELSTGYLLSFKKVKEAKTISQNRYIWLVFTFIADETGNTKDDIYKYYLDKFPSFKTIYVNKNEHYVNLSLSQMNKEQLSNFIDNVVIDSRQEGFDIPDPEDLKALQMYNYYNEKGMV